MLGKPIFNKITLLKAHPTMPNIKKILLPLLLIVVALVGYQLLRPPVYTAEVRFQIAEQGMSETEMRLGLTVQNCLSEIKSRDFLTTALANPTVGDSPWCKSLRDRYRGLHEALEADEIPNQSQFRVRLKITHRREAHIILNAIADAYIQWRNQLSDRQRTLELDGFRQRCIAAKKKLTMVQHDAKNLIGYTNAKELGYAIDSASEKLPELERMLSEIKNERSKIKLMDAASERARELHIKFEAADKQYQETVALLSRFADNKADLQRLDEAAEQARQELMFANTQYAQQEAFLRSRTEITIIQRAAPLWH